VGGLGNWKSKEAESSVHNFPVENFKTNTRNSPHLMVDDETDRIERISEIKSLKFEVRIVGLAF
jgi:hypothetical protein